MSQEKLARLVSYVRERGPLDQLPQPLEIDLRDKNRLTEDPAPRVNR